MSQTTNDINLSGLTLTPEGYLCAFFGGSGVADVAALYGSGDTAQIEQAVALLEDCAGALVEYGNAGRRSLILAQCDGVQEGEDCVATTKIWTNKRGKLISVIPSKMSVQIALYKEGGQLGPAMTRSLKAITIKRQAAPVADGGVATEEAGESA